MSDEQGIDLGLVNSNDVADVFVKTPDHETYPLPSLEHWTAQAQARRASNSFIVGDPELSERQERTHIKRPSLLKQISRSYTLPRRYPRTPTQATTPIFETSFNPEVVKKLRRWILSIIVVNFDLDQGPVIDGCCPAFPMSDVERDNICFSAIPDSFRGAEGFDTHAFRIREFKPSDNDILGERRPLSVDGFLYGFAFFSRRKDDASKRGYDQKSLIMLTFHPWPSFFIDLITRLGPMYLEHGMPMLESTCHNISNWPDPIPLVALDLGYLGNVVSVELPGEPDHQQSGEVQRSRDRLDKVVCNSPILASMAPVLPSPIQLFSASISHIWSIWECILLCEPVIIFGTAPALTSQAVWWFLDVLRPSSYGGDYRPYFTIHDKDYQSFINKRTPKQGLLIGVTNPLFESLTRHWPHKLVLGAKTPRKVDNLVSRPTPGWETKTHNRYISKDRELLKHLETVVKAEGLVDKDGSAGLLLRRHFTTRSVQFLVPLTRYLNTLIPSPRASASPLASPSDTTRRTLKPFNRDHFFASLKAHGSPLPFRSNSKQKEFYERWLRSPAFGLWMARQEETIHTFLRKGSMTS